MLDWHPGRRRDTQWQAGTAVTVVLLLVVHRDRTTSLSTTQTGRTLDRVWSLDLERLEVQLAVAATALAVALTMAAGTDRCER